MNDPNQEKTRDVRDPDPPGAPDKLSEDGGVRQYEGGKNPRMQAQRSNRQGSGQPTQQRAEDR